MSVRLAVAGAMLAALLVPLVARADVTVRLTLDPPQVRAGEQADLAVEVSGAQSAPAPSLPAVDGLTLRYVGPATQVSIVNGQMTASVTHHYTVVASRPGSFSIGPVTIAVGGKTYTAPAATLQVAAAGAATGRAAPGGDQLRLTLTLARPEVYLHERVPVAVRLSVGNVRVGDLQYPTIPGDGFALDKFPEPSQGRDGGVEVLDFKSTLTPLRSGALAVGPATMHMSVLQRSRRSDPFFGSLFGDDRREIDLPSDPATLTVLPLPDAGRPADFSGAVGHFDFDVQAGPLAVAAGDPVTIRSTIRGDGYLESVTPPAVDAADGLRSYPAQPASGQTPATAGERAFEQVVIPLKPGQVTIPAPRFSFFDPAQRAYRTVTRPPIVVTVRASAQAAATPQIVGAAPAKARPETLGQDIVSIKDAPGTLRPLGARRWKSVVFWGAQTLPLVAWIVAVVVDRRRRRLSGDVRYARFTRAGRAARAALAEARTALRAGDRARFHDTVSRAVRDYLGAKLDLPPGAVTADVVADRLRTQGLPAALGDDVRAILAASEEARFAPGRDGGGPGDPADPERVLDRAETLVRALERERRLGRALAAVWLLAALACAAHAVAAGGESPNTLFFQGNSLYGDERWGDAAAAYERVLAAGWESGNLHFNLGNAYFRAGDVGRAILAYERARRLIPGDPDLAANLGFARARSGDTDDDEPIWARLLLPLAGRLSTDTLLLAGAACWWLLVAVAITARFAPALGRGATGALSALGIALVLIVPAALYRLVTIDLPPCAVVVAPDQVAVRFEPTTSGTAHFQAKPGTVLRVLAEREGWAQVARRDGLRGWVEQSAVAAL